MQLLSVTDRSAEIMMGSLNITSYDWEKVLSSPLMLLTMDDGMAFTSCNFSPRDSSL